MRRYYIFATVFTVFSVGLVLLQYVLTADVRYDQQTESDLQRIEEAVNLHVQDDGALPENIDRLQLEDALRERADSRIYEYKVLERTQESSTEISYELCAEFMSDELDGIQTPDMADYSFEVHPAGRHCFTRTVYEALDMPSRAR